MITKSPIRSYRDLVVWQRAMELVRETYHATQLLPKLERYGLIAQMRRSAVSIAANIAEGHARRTTKDYLRFVFMASGSLRELETYWEVVAPLEYMSQKDLSGFLCEGHTCSGEGERRWPFPKSYSISYSPAVSAPRTSWARTGSLPS